MPTDPPSASLVRAELDRILASQIFTRSDRLSAFLRFIVERTLAGEGDSIKEQTIATDLYGKGPNFTAAADPIVRVDARRLRDRLREYYASVPPPAVVISVPKGSYTPVFTGGTPHAAVVPPSTTAVRATHARWIWMPAAAMALVIAWLVVMRWTESRAEPTRLLTVTSLPGAEEDPSLSPDGSLVAFSWNEPSSHVNGDIWVKSVDGDTMRRLTNTPDANEKYPDWSPDGQYVAFSRLADGTSSVFMVPALGGPEQLIAQRGGDATWLPDGRSLVMVMRTPGGGGTIVHHELQTGAHRQLIEAPAGFTDSHPRVSPDGKTLAFERQGAGRVALFLASMSGGEPTQVGEWTTGFLGGLTWSRDGRELLVGRTELSGRRLWRLAVDGRRPPSPIAGLPLGSFAPAISRSGAGRERLAFVSGQPDIGLRLIHLQGIRQDGVLGGVSAFCDSSRIDVPGRFSPDGTQVAFVSDRSGQQQVWVATRDESNLRSVTHFENATVNGGSWSPDGRQLTFDVTIGGNTDIFVVRSDGGPVTRLTQGPAIESDPEWSADGQWIYFSANETGRSEIWKIPARGGARVKLTSEAAFDPQESPDGHSIYFVDLPRYYGLGGTATLKRVSTQGGVATVVYSGLMPGAWAVAGNGILFITGHGRVNAAGERDALALYDFATGRVHPVGDLPFPVSPFGVNRFLTASKDGSWALAAHIDRWDRDIFVLDNFR